MADKPGKVKRIVNTIAAVPAALYETIIGQNTKSHIKKRVKSTNEHYDKVLGKKKRTGHTDYRNKGIFK